MNRQEAIDYALSKKGAEYELKVEWDNCELVKVGGKMFLLDGGEGRINLKCDPILAQELREQFEGVIPGYHMNKTHWNSIILGTDVTDEEIKQMIDHSYDLVVKSLTKKVRVELEL